MDLSTVVLRYDQTMGQDAWSLFLLFFWGRQTEDNGNFSFVRWKCHPFVYARDAHFKRRETGGNIVVRGENNSQLLSTAMKEKKKENERKKKY